MLKQERQKILQLLYSDPQNFQLAQTIAKACAINISSEIESLILMNLWCLREDYFCGYCCDFCNPPWEDYSHKYNKWSLEQHTHYIQEHRLELKELIFDGTSKVGLPWIYESYPNIETVHLVEFDDFPNQLLGLSQHPSLQQLSFYHCFLVWGK